MNLQTVGLGVFAAMLSFGAGAQGERAYAALLESNENAMAAYAEKRGLPAPQVQVYRYGMNLDIAKVVNVSPPIRSCNAVPSRMTYWDSAGKLNTLEYQVMGVCRMK
ncbi:DUF2790 domain-containing protein [Pseudomonas trivialis]|uniref:DUF2790 domain-containing protein n=1 Tax=Pseudomonas trivialis TaxID=200450 RepID=UPI0030D05F43